MRPLETSLRYDAGNWRPSMIKRVDIGDWLCMVLTSVKRDTVVATRRVPAVSAGSGIVSLVPKHRDRFRR